MPAPATLPPVPVASSPRLAFQDAIRTAAQGRVGCQHLQPAGALAPPPVPPPCGLAPGSRDPHRAQPEHIARPTSRERSAALEPAAPPCGAQCYHNKNSLTAGIIVAGWDKQKGGQVFAIPVGGGLLPRPFAIGGAPTRRTRP